MKYVVLSAASAAVVLFASCGLSSQNEEASSAGNQPSSLPIKGTWRQVLFQGTNSKKEILTWEGEAGTSQTVKFDISGEGVGNIWALQQCKPLVAEIEGSANPNNASVGVGRAVAILNIISLVKLVTNAGCDPNKPEYSMRWVQKESGSLFDPARLPDHLGTVSLDSTSNTWKIDGARSGDRECESLRGHRIVRIKANDDPFSQDYGVACIGYVDGAGKRLRMLAFSRESLIVSRIEFVR